jgi:ubiquinone/menaquinone biosynthesis C-methylase UbiE
MIERAESVERFFGEHAREYARSTSHSRGADLALLVEALGPKSTDIVLDVATGTGFTAIAIAPRVKHVTGIDSTEEMLVEARRLASIQGVTNIRFETGNALDLKFPEKFFDIVTTGRAAHHFQDVPRFLSEARRVLRTGGRLGVVDVSPPDGSEAFSNCIEKLRDSSHIQAFTPSKWESMVSAAGFNVQFTKVLAEPVTLEGWLYPVKQGGREEAKIREAWESSSQETRRLLRAHFDGGIRGWMKSRIILVASKK